MKNGVDSSCKFHKVGSPKKPPTQRVPKKAGRPKKAKFETKVITSHSESDDE